jgi:hypothetical protein
VLVSEVSCILLFPHRLLGQHIKKLNNSSKRGEEGNQQAVSLLQETKQTLRVV